MSWPQRIVALEHTINAAVLESTWLPGFIRYWYGWLRAYGGAVVYKSRFAPSRASPSRLIGLALRTGGRYLDVGANAGEMVTIAAAVAGSSGALYAFEPRDAAMRVLEQMRTVYRLSNLRLYQSLVADRAGTAEFFECESHPSSSSMNAGWAGGTLKAHKVVSLDQWSRDQGVEQLDVAKIDVEGAELQVIMGGRAFLAKTKPILILEVRDAEVRHRLFGYRVQEIFDALRSIGYTEFFCPRLEGLVPISSAAELRDVDHDLVAAHPGGPGGLQVLSQLRARY